MPSPTYQQGFSLAVKSASPLGRRLASAPNLLKTYLGKITPSRNAPTLGNINRAKLELEIKNQRRMPTPGAPPKFIPEGFNANGMHVEKKHIPYMLRQLLQESAQKIHQPDIAEAFRDKIRSMLTGGTWKQGWKRTRGELRDWAEAHPEAMPSTKPNMLKRSKGKKGFGRSRFLGENSELRNISEAYDNNLETALDGMVLPIESEYTKAYNRTVSNLKLRPAYVFPGNKAKAPALQAAKAKGEYDPSTTAWRGIRNTDKLNPELPNVFASGHPAVSGRHSVGRMKEGKASLMFKVPLQAKELQANKPFYTPHVMAADETVRQNRAATKTLATRFQSDWDALPEYETVLSKMPAEAKAYFPYNKSETSIGLKPWTDRKGAPVTFGALSGKYMKQYDRGVKPLKAQAVESIAERTYDPMSGKKLKIPPDQRRELLTPIDVKTAEYQQGFNDMVKKAWIFSVPLGASDIAQAPNVPKYLWDAAHGGAPDDPKRAPWKSLGMAGLAGAGTLFGLGFAGMGMKDLGLKLSLIAKRAYKNKALTVAEKGLAHTMDVPAYTRFGKSMSELSDKPYLSTPLKGIGYAAGGVAHPINKLEDYLSKKIVQGLGASKASEIGERLHLTSQGRIFDNPAVRAVSSVAALPVLIGGDALFAPYQPLDKESAYRQGYMDKLAQFRSSSEVLADSMGGGTGAQIGSMVPYFIPGVGTVMSAVDAGAQVGNMFSANKTMGQRVGHGAAALGNVGLAALNLIPGAGLLTGTGKALVKGVGKVAPGVANTMTKAAPVMNKAVSAVTVPATTMAKTPVVGKYITGNTGWQQSMKNWGTAGGKVAPGLAAGTKNVAGKILASPITHGLTAMSAGDAMSAGQEGTEQGAMEGVAKGMGAYRTEAPLGNWEQGAADYYRSMR